MKFLKDLFKKRKESYSCKPIELQDLLDDISEDFLEEINDDLFNLSSDIEKIKKGILDIINKFSYEKIDSSLSNREIHVLQGNRINYTKKLSEFLRSFEEITFENKSEFLKNFHNRLEKFQEEASDSREKLSDQFPDYVILFDESIIKLTEKVNEIEKQFEEEDIKLYINLKKEIKELNSLIIEKDKFDQEMQLIRQNLENVEHKKSVLLSRNSDLKEFREYSDYKGIEKKKEEIDSKMEAIQESIELPIRIIKEGLLEQEKRLDDSILSFFDSPIQSLESDKGYNAIDKIKRLKVEFDNQKKKKKYSDAIKKLDKKHIEDLLREYLLLKTTRSDLYMVAGKTKVMMDKKEIEYQLEHFNLKIKQLKEDIDLLNSKLNQKEIEGLKDKIISWFEKFSGQELIIE